MSKEASTFVALLRGINVGGKNKLPMSTLAKFFLDAGASNVTTYIQSGNVVFHCRATALDSIRAAVAAQLRKECNISSAIVLRTSTELDRIVQQNPFLKAGADPDALHVVFLQDRPGATQAKTLQNHPSPGDSLVCNGREVYLHLPNGVAKSKLTNAYFDRALGTTSTVRNWRTVRKLVELCAAASSSHTT